MAKENEEVLGKLLISFDALESAVLAAQERLNEKMSSTEEIVERVQNYSETIEKQRRYARELTASITKEDWSEVHRFVNLINELSKFIRHDANEILAILDAEFEEIDNPYLN